jgi:hypothetical protein
MALRGLAFARRIMAVYRKMHDPKMFLMKAPSHALMFFKQNRRLAQFEEERINTTFLPRSQCDPMETLC